MRYIQDGRIYLAGSEGDGCVKRKFSKTKSERGAK